MPMKPNNTIAVTIPTKATALVPPPLLPGPESFADGGGGANAEVCDGVEWESKGLVLEGGGRAPGVADAAGEGEELWGGGGGEEIDAGGKLDDCGDSGGGGREAGGKDWDGNGDGNGGSEVEL